MGSLKTSKEQFHFKTIELVSLYTAYSLKECLTIKISDICLLPCPPKMWTDKIHDCRKDISTHKSCVMCNKVLKCGCIHHPDLWEMFAGVWTGWRSGQWWDVPVDRQGCGRCQGPTCSLKTGATTSGISLHYFHPSQWSDVKHGKLNGYQKGQSRT